MGDEEAPKVMDSAHIWLAEIKGDITQASALLTLAFERGTWPDVAEANKILRHVQNRLANMETLALPENWRDLAERNGYTLHEEQETKEDETD